ncbi:hypothetical protein ILUMI_13972, partial [Ignelater luminosus]
KKVGQMGRESAEEDTRRNQGLKWTMKKLIQLRSGGKIQTSKYHRCNQSLKSKMAGHVHRMSETRQTKKVLLGGVGGKKRGRPKRQWQDAIKEDLTRLGGENRQALAEDRSKWKKLVERLKAISL